MPGTGLRTSARAGDRRVAGHLATMKLLFSGREVYICVLTPNRCGNKRCERYVAEGAGRIMLDGPGWGAKSSWKLRQWRSKPLTGLTDWSWIVRPKLLCQICKSAHACPQISGMPLSLSRPAIVVAPACHCVEQRGEMAVGTCAQSDGRLILPLSHASGQSGHV